MNGTTPGKENGYSDLVLSSNTFEAEQMKDTQPDMVIGMEIQGVYYEVKK